MAEYNSTVGVVLKDDFDAFYQTLLTIEKEINKIKDSIKEVYNVAKQLRSALNGKVSTSTSSSSTISSGSTQVKKYQQSISGLAKEVDNLGTKAKKTSGILDGMFSLGKVYFMMNYTKQIFRGIGNIINSSIEFTEIENYFEAAMGNMYNRALKFQEDLAEMFGTSLSTTMNAQAVYKNMIGTLGGISEELQYELSETVLKMTLDFSSLYNVDFDAASKKFQSALSKQVRPIRSTSGYDITQSVLQDTATLVGSNKAISQMSEMEKRLLVILTLMRQMKTSDAMKDFSFTIEEPANQLRVLKEQLQEVCRWIGSIFYGTIYRVLPYVNGFVMAIKELIKSFALLVGYQNPTEVKRNSNVLDAYDGLEDTFDNVGDSIDNANAKAKNFQKTLSGFDQLNIIKKPTEDTSSSNGGSGSIDPAILNALKDYEYIFPDVHMKANDIRDAILNGLKDVADFCNKYKPLIIGLLTGITSALILIESSKAGNILNKVVKYFTNMYKVIKTGKSGLQALLYDFTSLTPTGAGVVAIITLVTAAFVQLWETNEEWKGKVIEAWENIKKVIKGVYDATLKPIFMGIKELLLTVYEEGIKPLWNAWVDFVEVVSSVVLDLWNFLSPYVSEALEFLGPILTSAFKGLGSLIGSVIGGVISIFATLLTTVTNVIKVIVAIFNDAKEEFGLVIDALILMFSGVIEFLEGVFTLDFKKIFEGLVMIAVGFVESIVHTIKGLWNSIVSLFNNGGTIFNGIVSGIEKIFVNLVNSVISAVNNIISVPLRKINELLNALRNVSVAGIKPFYNLIPYNFLYIPYIPLLNQTYGGGGNPSSMFGYADGGFPSVGEMFIARENGIPELVGRMGSKTTVANNMQIVDGIKQGVKEAIQESNGTSGDIYIENIVKIGDDTITKQVNKAEEKNILRTGKPKK